MIYLILYRICNYFSSFLTAFVARDIAFDAADHRIRSLSAEYPLARRSSKVSHPSPVHTPT